MSNSYYTQTPVSFWLPTSTTGTTLTASSIYAATTNHFSIPYISSGPTYQLLTDSYQQILGDVVRNRLLQESYAAYMERIRREQREADERWVAQQRERQRLYEEEQVRIEAAARKLAEDVLSYEEYGEFIHNRRIFVFNEKSGTLYGVAPYNRVVMYYIPDSIRKRMVFEGWTLTRLIGKVVPIRHYCIVAHPEPVHPFDLLVAHYLLAKHDENTLQTVGCRSDL